MKEYRVQWSRLALIDMDSSIEWGLEHWGPDATERWLNDFETRIRERLSNLPNACSFAPESVDFNIEIRQLIVNRYRVLFTVTENEVRVLRIRGPFNGSV